MPTKEQKKDYEKQIRNKKYKTLIKNQFKKLFTYLKDNGTNKEELKKMVSETQKMLDKAANKNIIH